MNKWRAIVFDLDDTLFPESEYVLSGFRAVANWAETALNVAADVAFTELKTLFDAGARGDTFNRWLTSRNAASAETIAEMVAVYRRHQPVIRPFAGVVELLEFLHSRYRLGLVSDGYLDVQRGKFAALDLARHFDAVVFSDEFGREYWKPNARPFEAVLSLLEVNGTDAVYVADNPHKDFIGARSVGMRTIRVLRANGVYSHLEPPTDAHAPDSVIEDLDELRNFIEQ